MGQSLTESQPETVDSLLKDQCRYHSRRSRFNEGCDFSSEESHPVPENRSSSSVSGSQGSLRTEHNFPASSRFSAATRERRREPEHRSRRHRAPISVDPRELPTRSQSQVLVEAYLRSFQSVSPLVNVPRFLHAYDTFWGKQSLDRPSFHEGPAFVALLYAVLLAGSIVIPAVELEARFGGRSRSQISRELYSHTVRILDDASYTRTPSIDSFTAFLISESIWLRGK